MSAGCPGYILTIVGTVCNHGDSEAECRADEDVVPVVWGQLCGDTRGVRRLSCVREMATMAARSRGSSANHARFCRQMTHGERLYPVAIDIPQVHLASKVEGQEAKAGKGHWASACIR